MQLVPHVPGIILHHAQPDKEGLVEGDMLYSSRQGSDEGICVVLESQEPTTGVQIRVDWLRQEVGVQIGSLFLDEFLQLVEDQFHLGNIPL